MDGKRIALIGLGLVVAVVVALLVLDVTSSDAGGPDERRVAQATGKTEVVETPIPDTRRGIHRAAAPDLDVDDPAAAQPDPGDGTREYVKEDGTLVRDHREAAPNLKPRPVSRESLLKIRNDVRPLVKECGKQLRQRDRALRGKLQADVTVSILDGHMTIDAVDLQVQGLEDSEYTDCVRRALEGFSMYAPGDQGDVDKHTMSLPFKVP